MLFRKNIMKKINNLIEESKEINICMDGMEYPQPEVIEYFQNRGYKVSMSVNTPDSKCSLKAKK